MHPKWQRLISRDVQLGPGIFRDRRSLIRGYLLSLQDQNLLQNHYLEAGIGNLGQLRNSLHGDASAGDDRHWGWESPTCQVRGHFLGHWLSAAARLIDATGDDELALKANRIVAELARCQERNGGEWCFSLPEKYLHWTAQGKPTWAPQYVLHKTLMGLVDMHAFAGSQPALDILNRATAWFQRWTAPFSRKQMDDILDVETGGMLEVWADAYGVTGSQAHLDLIERYTRNRLFDALLEGRDALTNLHANTTIPEIHGAARAYEVTGDERWRRIVEAYWKCAVDDRGFYCTGGQTSGEIWTPPFEFAARRGDKNQEHCTVYNMIRLADYLFRWSGDVKYSDYIERNLYNGILAQQHPQTGMVSYFLPLEAGGRKRWGSPTCDFWCCHGSVVQAHALNHTLIGFVDGEELVISQYIPARLAATVAGSKVALDLTFDQQATGAADNNASAAGARHRPTSWAFKLKVTCEQPVDMVLSLRVPWWAAGAPTLRINGQTERVTTSRPGFHSIRRRWHDDTIQWVIPKEIRTAPIPDEPATVAFLDGPVVLAGLCDREITLTGDLRRAARLLAPDNERQWGTWLSGWRTVGQPANVRLRPLYEIVDEPYTVYFPIRAPRRN